VEVVISAKLLDNILTHSSTFHWWGCLASWWTWGTWQQKWARLNAGESNGKLPLRICPGCSVLEPYQSPNWALVCPDWPKGWIPIIIIIITQSIAITKTNWLLLFRWVIAIYSENYVKHTNDLCVWNFGVGFMYASPCALKQCFSAYVVLWTSLKVSLIWWTPLRNFLHLWWYFEVGWFS
jgi:hypothetical protein